MKQALFVVVAIASATCGQAALTRANSEYLLRSTYKIEGTGSAGAAFVLLEPIPKMTNASAFVLVTAAHVLNAIQGSNAVLWIRSYDGTNYTKESLELNVRTNERPTWIRHQSADVAVMRINFRTSADRSMIHTDVLADDQFLKDFEISPGDEVYVIGFPLNFEGNAGFGIVRSGRIASFPLTPSQRVQTFLLDFQTFPGDSGGPVFMAETRHMEDGSPVTVNVFRVLGLVSQDLSKVEEVSSLTEKTIKQHKLGIAVVVHAELIRETIKMLPLQ